MNVQQQPLKMTVCFFHQGRPYNSAHILDTSNRMQRQGDIVGAIEYLKGVLESYPTFPEAHQHMGLCYLSCVTCVVSCVLSRIPLTTPCFASTANFTGSVHHNEKALEYMPNFPGALNNMGHWLVSIVLIATHGLIAARHCAGADGPHGQGARGVSQGTPAGPAAVRRAQLTRQH